jgi:DHA1 family inner membrane transport protein
VLTWLLLRWGLHPRRWHDRVPERRRTWPEIRSTLALPGPWLYAVAFVTYGIQYFAVATWLPTFLIEQQGLTLAAAAGATAVVVIANVVGNLISGGLMRRGWKRWVLLMIAYPGMAGFAWMLFAEASPVELRIPAAIAFCLVGGLLPAAALSGAPSHARTPDEVVVCGGVVVQGANTGSLLGAPLVALAVGWLGGWQHAWTVMAALGGLGILTALMLAKIEGGLRR